MSEAYDDRGRLRAAGGVVWRSGSRGTEVLVVHRPRYDDWTFPKGKADPGEADEACAVREVEEETGVRCTLGVELQSLEYVDNKGRPKVVRYWAMAPVEARPDEPGPGAADVDEVDQLAWLTPEEAAGRLTYERDAEVLASFLARSGGAGPAAPG